MTESILNHLFLPQYLPSSAENDFLMENTHQNEYKILEFMEIFLNQLQSTDTLNQLPILETLINCTKHWSFLQNLRNFSESNVQTTMEQLSAGSFLPLYFHAQNAAILIEIEENHINQALISAWQVLLPNTEIVSSFVPPISCFPVPTYRLQDRSQLNSKAHCELLVDLMLNTIEQSKAHKASRAFDETRDVPVSHYVCQWWIQQFQGITIDNNSSTPIEFKKKHRDQVRWDNSKLPFRRSGLWMTIKVVFHTILTKRLGHVGTIVYKALITYFLTFIISEAHHQISTDLLAHCIRKIVRRLNKIECLSPSVDANNVNQWIQCTKQKIQMEIDEIIPKPDWQESIRIIEQMKNNSLMIDFKLDNSEIYQHSCKELNTYLSHSKSNTTFQFSSNIKIFEHDLAANEIDYIPSIEILTKKFQYTIERALIRLEIWVESCLEKWFNQSTPSINTKNRFEILLGFFEDYQNAALNHYYSEKGPTDPIGYSRFILTCLTIIHSMHIKLCNDSRFERLKLHSIHIPSLKEVFEFLVLPMREDMIRARDLYDYFKEFKGKPYPDLLTNIIDNDAFGVYYASQSLMMINIMEKIKVKTGTDKQKKIEEVEDAKTRHTDLMNSIKDLSCECTYGAYYRGHQTRYTCQRCSKQEQANNIKVEIYESPLPSERENALAVVFELQMPAEIRSYRDVIWQFINRPVPHPSHDMHEWLSVAPHHKELRPFYTGPSNNKVKLVSLVTSITETHYRIPSITSAPVDDFLHEDSLKVQILPTKSMEFKAERRALTPQLDDPDYIQLQMSIDSTHFVQNQVIAKLFNCPVGLKSDQFVEFGSFRSGHHLQWLNLLSILETESLSLAEESVAILIIHSILQYGPLTPDRKEIFDSWCSETHEQLLDEHFVDEFIEKLNRYLDERRSNWQNELVLIVITMITMRILTICDLTIDMRVAKLVLKCREIGEEWINLISNSIQAISSSNSNEILKLRLKLINIGISCVLTFSTHQSRLHYLLSSNEHIISLLKAVTTMHDNIILNNNQLHMSTFIKNMMKFCERTLVIIQPKVTELLQKTSYQSLNEFAAKYWAVILRNRTMNGKWKKRLNDPYDGWYDCQYESRYLSIDCIRGIFLVDNMTIGFLPEQITTNDLFRRVFGNHVFEVQPSQSSGTYITKHAYHKNGTIQYEFHFNDETKHLTIHERHTQTKDIFQLVPHSYFKDELPDTFVSNHSHWWNENDQIVKFRPVSFKNADFFTDERYILSLSTGYITFTETINRQILINQSSKLFQVLYDRYFIRLDNKPFVYMSEMDSIIHIRLDRLGLAFQYDCKTNIITSREYSDMRIDEDQWLGTLTGLTSGLLLTPMTRNNPTLGHYPYRKLIVPFGTVKCTRTTDLCHQTVTIHRKSFLHQYFVFILNDRLKIFQSTDSPTGWLYLSLLHAMTSHPLPDQYTGMTGMERAFQLLYSAGCWSNQPYDRISLNILDQIASISPKVNYYPEHLTCMEKIDWNSDSLPYSMQHTGYYLIAKKLFDNSQSFNFMFPSLISKETPKIFEDKQYNEVLLKRFYWKYRDSYNPASRLSTEMENDILRTITPKTYQQTSKNYPSNNKVSLVDHLYNTGDVKLEEFSIRSWLPLCQWLVKGKQLNTLWIGMLQSADRIKTEAAGETTDDIRRFECLLNFLHYIADIFEIQPFFLQLLKTVLKESTISFTFDNFPPFIQYTNIQEISIVQSRISRPCYLDSPQHKEVLAEVQRCLMEDCDYKNVNNLLKPTEIVEINKLLKPWQLNRKLRLFLEDIQSRICSVPIEYFDTKVSYISQQFTHEMYKDHHQIQFKFSNESIDPTLLKNAEQKFHHFNQDHFIKLKCPRIHQQNIFPQEIFLSNNDQDNSLSEMKSYFHNHLTESWNKFLEDEQNEQEYPSTEQTSESLGHVRKESNQFWNEFIKSITLSHEQLSQIGLVTRPTPSNLINLLQPKRLNSERLLSFELTNDQCTLLGGTIVNWTLEQQMERALYFVNQENMGDYKKEMLQIPHSNWIPSENISWLILELEMNITIREMQINVANHMIKPNLLTKENIVMQMNMGEGKTSVILPMLSIKLASNSNLVRIIVLRSLFPTNYQSLKSKFGGLLNQRIFPFVCRRDFNFNQRQINQIYHRFQQGLENGDIILTSPEDLLSFDLLTIDKCRKKEFSVGYSMLTMQRWLKKYVRDILDESDEILHVKYQLIYTVGDQQQVDAGAERWLTIQLILNLVKKHSEDIYKMFSEEVCYKSSERKSAFPQFRLQSQQSYKLLCELIANDWIDSGNYHNTDKQIILSFILNANSSIDDLNNKFSHHKTELFLIVRGLLSSEVLFIALKKRHRVNYGVNSNSQFNRLMAVPFRAKDVASDRTEFGHPDVALILTYLSYYFSGLNNEQLLKCFYRLSEENDAALIYNQWISSDEKDQISSSIQEWKSVNLRNNQQRIQILFPTFRYNMSIINYFLNKFVFPKEAKQFPHKLIASAWDLSSNIRSNIITGFSGTNDTQLLLPVHIHQNDLPELQKTDAIVVNNLLKLENENYQSLAMNITSIDILHQIVYYHQSINVILDVGGLFIDGTNRDIAMEWLKISDKTKIDYVVYFDSDRIYVCDHQSHHHPFATSPACERVDRCIFYLDDIHTRGTDFKFPTTFKAALTLGNGLTKDRFVQAAMRMRKLGNGHSLTFWSSYEVHQQIIKLKNNSLINNNSINVIDILRWVYENTQQATWDGLHLWASQSLTFQRKLSAFRNIQWNDHQQTFDDALMEQLAEECLESEIIELKQMYGHPRVPKTLFDIHSDRYQQIKNNLLTDIQEEVLKRLKNYAGIKKRLALLLDEEQQKELEQELEEERQLVERPPFSIGCEPVLHREIDRLCDIDGPMLKLDELPTLFRRLPYAFTDTTFSTICHADSWPDNFWVSAEFQRVIATKEKSLNPFLRPPRWLIIYRNQHLIFLTALEANHLIGRLKDLYHTQQSNKPPITTVRLLLPRIKQDQAIFVNIPVLTTPSLINFPILGIIPLEWLAHLFVFNGTLYFGTVEEQNAYCQLLSLCPKPRTKEEDAAFEKGWIDMDGFVKNPEHRRHLQMNQGRFNSNPITFIKQLIENRHKSKASISSHIGSIILDSRKLIKSL